MHEICILSFRTNKIKTNSNLKIHNIVFTNYIFEKAMIIPHNMIKKLKFESFFRYVCFEKCK